MSVLRSIFLLLLCFTAIAVSAELADTFTLHNIYTDHMVLQRGKNIKISGTAAPGKSVEVTFDGKSTKATSGKNGEWCAVLPPHDAGGPYTLTVSGKNQVKRVLKDVLVGEVWLCSGQSNMAFILKDAFNFEAEMKTAENLPQLRIFDTSRIVSFGKKCDDIKSAGWQVVTPLLAKWYSAIGFLFGRDLHKKLNVPVGIINSSWGGTAIEPWMSTEAFNAAGRKDLASKSVTYPAVDYEKFKELRSPNAVKWENNFFRSHAKEAEMASNWCGITLPEPEKWKSVSLPRRLNEVRIYRPGITWFRCEVNVPTDFATGDLTLSLGPIGERDETFFNGVPIGATGTGHSMPGWVPRVYRIPGYLVKPGKNTIAVRVISFGTVGGFYGNAGQLYLSCEPRRISLAGDFWKMRPEFQLPVGFAPRPGVAYDSTKNYPSAIYNASLAGLQRFPVCGVLWYQGEGNTSRAKEYAVLFKSLITSWRNEWQDPELAFIYAQLSSLERHAPKDKLPDDFYLKLSCRESGWAELREAQSDALALPRTAMVVTTDVGNPLDIHPRDKQTVAKRMVNEALRIVYNEKTPTFPRFEKAMISGNKVIVCFANAESGLVAKGGKLRRFAVAGRDGIYHWADAEIDNNKVILSSSKVAEPVAVRYAWDNNPIDANLFNKEGLPASGFRSVR